MVLRGQDQQPAELEGGRTGWVSRTRGALTLGTGLVCLVLGVVIVALVGYLSVTREDLER